MKIEIKCQGAQELPYNEIYDLQDDLKDLSPEAEKMLADEIINTGFAFPPCVWIEPETKKAYLIDGHQRMRMVRQLASKGYEIPPIPVVPVQADSMAKAKERVLQASSQYGKMTAQGLFNFTKGLEIDVDSMIQRFKLPHVDLAEFKSGFFTTPAADDKTGSAEISEGDVASKLVHTCPKCNFQFT